MGKLRRTILRPANAVARHFLRRTVAPIGIWFIKRTKTELLQSRLENRIGHQVVEPLFLELARRNGDRQWNRVLVLWDVRALANKEVFDALPSTFRLIRNRLLRRFLGWIAEEYYSTELESPLMAVGRHDRAAEFHRLTRYISPGFDFLQVSEESERLKKVKKSLGIPGDRWLCCLHIREPGFFSDERFHSFRNAHPENAYSAIDAVVNRGGFVIRLGKPQFTAVPERENFIDLTQHQLRSAEADFLLSRNSRFFLGNTSGIVSLASSRGVPVLAVNVAPLAAAKFWGPRDLAIPKLYRDRGTGEFAPFGRVLRSGDGDIRSSQGIFEKGYELVENSDDEIGDATSEMIDVLDRKFQPSERDRELQRRMQALFSPQNYSYHSKTKIGHAFLRKYEFLIGPENRGQVNLTA